VPKLNFASVLPCLHRLVKAEHRRGNLKPSRQKVGTVAKGGKNIGTLHWQDLCRVLGLDAQAASAAQVTVTLVSSEAAPCIHLRPIAGITNEIGSMPELLDELHAVYSHTHLFGRITTDAGNTSLCAMTRSIEHGWLQWTHARQLLRIERVVEDPATAKKTIGNRYYVSSETPEELSPDAALKISRAHFRCENETHWTADAQMQEDRRRLAWSRHQNGLLIVTVLRMIAIAILAVARRLSRMDHSRETPSWRQVAEHFLLELCGPRLLAAPAEPLSGPPPCPPPARPRPQ